MRRSFIQQRWWCFLVIVALASAGGACKKRKLPTLDPDEPPPAQATTEPTPDEVKKKSPPPAPVAGRPRELTVAKPAPVGMIDREPDRANVATFNFPIPDGIKALGRTETSAVFETVYTVDALKRFYAREMGRDGKMEARTYGFKMDASNGNGFIMVTQTPGSATTTLSVIAPRARQPSRGVEGEDR